MSLPRDIARHRLFWTWHRRIGIVAALLVLVLSLTGLALNHTDRLGLDERYVTWEWLLDRYGIEAPAEAVSYVADNTRITLMGDRLYADRQIQPVLFSALQGVVFADGFLAAAAGDAILLVTPDGQLVDRLGAESGVPAGIETIGVSDAGRILVGTAASVYGAGMDALVWSPEPEPPGEIRWAVADAADASLLNDLRQDFRGRIVPVERVLLDLHSGRIAGWVGTLLMDAAAVLLLVLALTGSWLWFVRRG